MSLQTPTARPPIATRQLIREVQSRGLRLADPDAGAPSRRRFSGAIDHKAVTVDDGTVMVPAHTGGASQPSFFAAAPEVRVRIMPGKASVTLPKYMEAFRAAVGVFGRGQVSTYLLAGLGDTREAIPEMSAQLVDIGVYPFVVPFVPVSGTPLRELDLNGRPHHLMVADLTAYPHRARTGVAVFPVVRRAA